ncbi:MAG: gluconokinase [Devosia sp.]
MASIVVMGVSGCGKTSFGETLATALHRPFIEGDALHPAANIAKMSAGVPLDDADRWPWLDLVGRALGQADGMVVSCSALKRIYRDRLRRAAGRDMVFVCLNLPRTVLEQRLHERKGHFMPPALLDSQLATLELPTSEPDALVLDATGPIESDIEQTLTWLRGRRREQGE